MYVIIDVKLSSDELKFPYSKYKEIDIINIIITDFNQYYQTKSGNKSTINNIKDDIENNIVIVFDYHIDAYFLKNFGIVPNTYIDLKKMLNYGTFEQCCYIYDVNYDKHDICRTLYNLSSKNILSIRKGAENIIKTLEEN